jgi:predicted amidohydrolase YtcJ
VRAAAPGPVWLIVFFASACASVSAPTGKAPPAPVADRIFVGGPVVTVDPEDRVVEALAIRDGRILAVGSEAEVLVHRGETTRVTDLAGRALLPGFFDAHGHITQVAALAAAADIAPPPVGPVTSIPRLQAVLREHIAETAAPTGGFVLGFGYDDSLLDERRSPTRDELDAVSTEHPIVILHVSLHLGVANSAALALAGVDASTPDPAGGVFRRRPGTREPDGVLEEHALYAVLGILPTPDLDTRLELLDLAQARYAAAGFTTAQDGATGAADFALLEAAAARGRLVVDVVSYPHWMQADAILARSAGVGVRAGRLEIGGAKLVLDGSPQGKTAWLTRPYLVPPPGQPADYRGYPAMPDAAADRFVAEFFARDVPVIAHANGDAAADQLLDAVARAADAHGNTDRRTVLIHAQTVRPDQLDRMVALGVTPSYFVSHTFFWGDWHRDSVLGPERAARISPAASSAARGLRFSFHADAPVTPPDPLRLVQAGVRRETRSGAVLGPDERVSPMQAIRSVTYDAAWQTFEEDDKGSLEPGKRADLVVLSDDPLSVPSETLVDLEVVETIKDGVTIHPRPLSSGRDAARTVPAPSAARQSAQ